MHTDTAAQGDLLLGQLDRLFPVPEAAALLGVRPETLRRWSRSGKFPKLVPDKEEQVVACRRRVNVLRVRERDLANFLRRGAGFDVDELEGRKAA